MGDVAYGIGKSAMDRMAHDMAIELFTENVTMVSLWPGLVKTENVEAGAIDGSRMTYRWGRKPGDPDVDVNSLLNTALAETPLFSGRAVAALARDKTKMDYTGKVLIPAVMAGGYGLVDERGVRSPPLVSLKFLLSCQFKGVLESLDAWRLPGECYDPPRPLTPLLQFLWRTMPDFGFPGWIVRFSAATPNL